MVYESICLFGLKLPFYKQEYLCLRGQKQKWLGIVLLTVCYHNIVYISNSGQRFLPSVPMLQQG